MAPQGVVSRLSPRACAATRGTSRGQGANPRYTTRTVPSHATSSPQRVQDVGTCYHDPASPGVHALPHGVTPTRPPVLSGKLEACARDLGRAPAGEGSIAPPGAPSRAGPARGHRLLGGCGTRGVGATASGCDGCLNAWNALRRAALPHGWCPPGGARAWEGRAAWTRGSHAGWVTARR
jgi:hypothetical protein